MVHIQLNMGYVLTELIKKFAYQKEESRYLAFPLQYVILFHMGS